MASTPYSTRPGLPRPSESDSHGRSPDLDSIHSNSPLQTPAERPTYPPLPSHSFSTDDGRRSSRQVRIQSEAELNRARGYYDAERAQTMPMPDGHNAHSYHNAGSRSGSWDMLGGIRKLEHSYEEFNPSNASEPHLAFADGDVPSNRVRNAVHNSKNVAKQMK